MSEAAFEFLKIQIDSHIGWLTIDRPKKLNALNRRVMEEIDAAVADAIDDGSVGVLVITGSGEKAFVAGADIAEMASMDPAEAQRFSGFLQRVLARIERSPKPVIAAVNGFALGGGCELALACHLRIAAENARFGQPEVGLGLMPGAGGTIRLPRIVGRGHALDLILRGQMIDATEAHRIGLANRVVPAAELTETVEQYAKGLLKMGPQAVSRCLEAVISGAETSQDEAMRLESSLFGLCFATEDMQEGTTAFLEKRKASFKGR